MTKQNKVTKLLIKWGHNEQSAESMVERNYETAISCLGADTMPSKLADFISCVDGVEGVER